MVVEVFMDDRWAVVDPAYRRIFRLPNGEMVTRSDLANPAIFRQVTESIPDYPQSYTYEQDLAYPVAPNPIDRQVPAAGAERRLPVARLEEKINWTLLVERDSFAMLVASGSCCAPGWPAGCPRFLLLSSIWHVRLRLRDQVVRVGQVLAGSIQH